MDDIIKNEFILTIDEYGKAKTITNLYALARLIQTLFFLKPNTYPNHPSMGIGIENYKFEFLDNQTIANLTANAREQIDTYIPNNNITKMQIEKANLNDKNGINTLLVKFELSEDIINASNIKSTNNFILSFSMKENSSNVISKILI